MLNPQKFGHTPLKLIHEWPTVSYPRPIKRTIYPSRQHVAIADVRPTDVDRVLKCRFPREDGELI